MSTPRNLAAQDVLVMSQLIDLIRNGRATTRGEIQQVSGLGRRIVTERLDEALELGLIAEGDLAPSLGGRAPRTYHLNASAGVILTADVGVSEMRIAIASLDGEILSIRHEPSDVADGPEVILSRVRAIFGELIATKNIEDVWGIAVGVPGPVNYERGTVVAPPIMPGWDGFDVRGWFRRYYDAPVWVDNDVNLMAFGEARRDPSKGSVDLLYVKVGTGIGSGFITEGRIHRGHTGAAGDIGHFQVTDDPGVVCRCGKIGCLEAVAGGWALQRKFNSAAETGASAFLEARRRLRGGHILFEDVGDASHAGDPYVTGVLAESARTVGMVAADIVNFANPGIVVLGGGVLRAGDPFFDAFAQTVRTQAIALATQDLTIRGARLEFAEGVTGGALLAAESLLRPDVLRIWLDTGRPLGSAARIQQASSGSTRRLT